MRFRYSALNSRQELKQGNIQAQTREAAIGTLQRSGLMVLSIRTSSFQPVRAWFWRPPFNTSAMANLTQQLATLLTAGQPLEKAMATLARQQTSLPARAVLERMRERLKQGCEFSSALEAEQEQFPALYRSMVRAGESSGTLPQALRQLGDYLESSHALRSAVINALIYPAFLLVGVVGSVTLLLTFVIPQFIPVFADMGIQLPMLTRCILWLGEHLQRHGIGLLAAAMATILLVSSRLRRPQLRHRFDLEALRLPILGELLRQSEATKASRTLGTLIQNGVGLVQSLRIVEHVSSNAAIRRQFHQAIDHIKDGRSLALALDQPRLLPDLALDMISVGEASGTLGAMLLKVSEIFEQESRRTITRLMAAFTPVLTVVMAVLVMGIMLAIMLPLMSLINNI